VALLSDMNQPLGNAVGNALEVIEAIDALRGGGPADFRAHCLHVCAHMLVLGKRAEDLEAGERMAEQALADGRAFEMWRALVQAQGGDVSFVDDPGKFPRARFIDEVPAPRSGILSQVHARSVGEASVALGAGRAKKDDPIDHAVGLVIHHKVGERVEQGQPLFTVHANDESRLAEARQAVLDAHVFSNKPVPRLPLFYD
jgi:pyrimidine-nucleoside phosphorylase